MNRSKIEKVTLLLVVLFVIFSLINFQRVEYDRTKDYRQFDSRREIRRFNQGLLWRSRGIEYASDQVLVKFKPAVSPQSVKAALAVYETKIMKRIPRIDVYQLQIPKATAVEEILYVLRQNPDVEYASPNYKAYIAVTPNDEFFWRQYALHNPGGRLEIPGSPQGKENADIKAPNAWDETKGSENILIALIDTGVDFNHPDLKNKINSSGRDFVNNDFDATDDNGHGTVIAGILGAETNNKEGMAGVVWNCKIMPVKSMDEDGSGYYSWIIEGIIWAVENGASVINLSLGGDVADQSLESAVKYAFDEGVVIAAAAGNDSDSVLYPAAYDAYCLAVAATNYNDERMEWSNFGPEVDVAAPGMWILSTAPTWYPGQVPPWEEGDLPYGFWGGTSMAVAHVTGLAALIKNIKPWLSASEIMSVIRYSADDVNSSEYPGEDEFIGYGRINMEKALVPIPIKIGSSSGTQSP
jgi:subtilisin family serine protease